MTEKQNKLSLLIFISFFGSFIFGALFVSSIYFSLPSSDTAYGQGLITTFKDPFVFTIAITYILSTGLLFSPIIYFCLRAKNLKSALPIIFGTGIIWIVAITPFSARGGLIGFYVIYLFTLLYCRFARANFLILKEK